MLVAARPGHAVDNPVDRPTGFLGCLDLEVELLLDGAADGVVLPAGSLGDLIVATNTHNRVESVYNQR